MSRSLTKEMRVATRDIHRSSDALVNLKLAFGEWKTRNSRNFLCFHEISLISFEQQPGLG
jgi:hypothetical protein